MSSNHITRRAVTASLLAAPFVISSAARAQGAPLKLRLQGVGATVATLPDLYARVFKIYEKHGLDVEHLAPIYNANGAMQSVIQGSADVTYGGGSSVIAALNQGRPIKLFGTVIQGFELKVSLAKGGLEKAAKAGATPASPIKDRAAAMKGMRIAAPASGSSSDLLLRYSFKKWGLDPVRDLVIQPMSDIPAMLAAVRQGAVDGLAGTAATANARAESEGVATRYIAFEEEDPVLRSWPPYALLASDDFLKKNMETARRLLMVFHEVKQAIRRGLTAEEIAAVKKVFFPDMADKTLADGLAISLPLLKTKLEPTHEQFDALILTNNAVQEVPAKFTFEQAFYTSLAAEIDKLP